MTDENNKPFLFGPDTFQPEFAPRHLDQNVFREGGYRPEEIYELPARETKQAADETQYARRVVREAEPEPAPRTRYTTQEYVADIEPPVAPPPRLSDMHVRDEEPRRQVSDPRERVIYSTEEVAREKVIYDLVEIPRQKIVYRTVEVPYEQVFYEAVEIPRERVVFESDISAPRESARYAYETEPGNAVERVRPVYTEAPQPEPQAQTHRAPRRRETLQPDMNWQGGQRLAEARRSDMMNRRQSVIAETAGEWQSSAQGGAGANGVSSQSLTLLDTQIIVDMLEGHREVAAHVASLEDDLAVSVVTHTQLYAKPMSDSHRAALDKLLSVCTQIDMNEEIARDAAIFMSEHGVPFEDAVIAATVAVFNLNFAARDADRFPMFELGAEDI